VSAFVVDHKTINRIISKIDSEARKEGQWWIDYRAKPLFEAAGVRLLSNGRGIDKGCLEILGLAMLRQNYDAVGQRYPDTLDGEGLPIEDKMPGKIGETSKDYGFLFDQTPKVWALKSLRCLLYQMSEGDVPERPFYKALELLSFEWALEIVSGSPEYDAAPWG
jgi:hypothetical protein